MADENIKNAWGNCQRLSIIHPQTAKGETLPRSLKHLNVTQALDDAHALACFLQRVAGEVSHTGEPLFEDTENNEAWGYNLCFMLLRDKINIAKGDLKFPFEALADDNAPPLWP